MSRPAIGPETPLRAALLGALLALAGLLLGAHYAPRRAVDAMTCTCDCDGTRCSARGSR